MQRHLKDALTPPDHLVPELSQGTAMIVEMMMAKDARDRYQNASQLLEDLDAVIAGQPPVHARPGETFVTQFEGTAQQAGAEADAPIPVLPGSSRGMSWLSLALGALLLASALVNMWLLMR
jgi:hypothetical protein